MSDWKDDLSETQLEVINDLPESVQYYFYRTTEWDNPRFHYHDFVVDYYKGQWTSEQLDNFEKSYNNSLSSQSGSYHVDYGLNKENRVQELQRIEDIAAELDGREPEFLSACKNVCEAVDKEQKKLAMAPYSNEATEEALGTILEEMGQNYVDPLDAAMKDFETSEAKAQIEETISFLETQNKEDLVRGALLFCSYGSHPRMLNLNPDHGVYIRDKPQIHAKDAVPGKYGDTNFNIGWFGHCSSPDPPSQTISLRTYTPVDDSGNYRMTPEDSASDGPECDLCFNSNLWKNTDERASVTDNSSGITIATSASYYVATTQSYILCAHGGIIFPLASGQLEFNIYSPAFAACPFPIDMTENSLFMKWCDKNDVCPAWPGTDVYDAWYSDKLQVLIDKGQLDWDKKEDFIIQRDELQKVLTPPEQFIKISEDEDINDITKGYELQRCADDINTEKNKIDELGRKIDNCNKEAEKLYTEWLEGNMQFGVTGNSINCKKIEEGNVMRDLYYNGCSNIPSLNDELQTAKIQHGSLDSPKYD